MRRATRSRLLVAPLALALVTAASAVAAEPSSSAESTLAADFEGKQIRVSDVGLHYCHDLQAPVIHCYAEATTLDAAVARLAAARGVTLAALAATYVQVFRDRDYRGATAYLSGDYPNLSTIGWNDSISSFKALTSGNGEFREHTSYYGLDFTFCCSRQVIYVGDAWNDKFSSLSALP